MVPDRQSIGKRIGTQSPTFYVCLGISIALLIAGFIVPPQGVIDGSVLEGVGLLFLFASLRTIDKAIDKGVGAKIEHGDVSVTVGDLDGDGSTH